MPGANPSSRPRDLALFGGVLALAAYVCVLGVAYYFRLRTVQRHHLESAWMWFVGATLLFSLTAKAPAGRGEGDRMAEDIPWYLPFALVAAALGLFFPALRLGFLSDDFTLADLAARNQFFGQSWAFLRPLPLLIYKGAGGSPAALHAFVVILHGVNAALVYRLAVVVGLPPRRSFAAGALFLAFPASLEAVAWCAGVQDVLMTTGVLGAVVAASASSTALSLAALTAALFSKETAVAAPFLIWLSNRQRWRTAAAALAVAGAYGAWRLASKPLAAGYAAAPSSYTVKELLVRPFATLVVPFRGALLARWPLLGVLLVAGLALLLVRAAWLWRGSRARILAAGALALWVVVSIAPVYSMFDISATLQGSRYVYLAAAGWSILLAALLMPSRSRFDLLPVVAVCAIGVAGIQLNLGPWIHAAQMRDEVIVAVAHARAAGCASVWIRNVPDSTQGAYVFRNGLPEAIAPTPLTSAAPASCWISVPFAN
jgi:hypothetical protein